jgi:anhydro-N-acetylmuramic acid kinase
MESSKTYTAIGLMSGTSLDGVDAALIETDGREHVRPLGFVSMPYAQETRAVLRACFGRKDRTDPALKDAERILTLKHAEAVRALMEETGKGAGDVDVIGFHGQTVYHAPKKGLTVQIGDGALLAKETDIPVVCDFRVADVKAGGEGAPLAPVYHAARIRGADVPKPAAILNIGGVANVTWIGEGDEDILAFDTGTGNALMDDWALKHTGRPYDEDGLLARSGKPRMEFVAGWMEDGYFRRTPPKSLDRDQWDIAALGPLSRQLGGISKEDGAATLLEFTVEGIVRSVQFMKAPPKNWYACGGGRRNRFLMKGLAARLAEEGYGVLGQVEDLGWNGDATEGECFAYLAVRSLLGLPISFPTTTGVKEPMTGGFLFKKP